MVDLQRVIRDLNISQVEFSNILGVSQTAVSQVCNGKMQFPKSWEQEIESKFGVDLRKYYINKLSMVSDFEPEYRAEKSMDKLLDGINDLIRNNEKLIDNNTKLVEANSMLSKKILEMAR